MVGEKELDARFRQYLPRLTETPEKQDMMRDHCRWLAGRIDANVPDSREKSLALTHLEEVLMWANKAISKYEGVDD